MKTPKMTPSKPVGTGATRLKFNEKPTIWPTEEAKKSNPALETSLVSKDALGSEIGTNAKYAAKSKKGYYDKSVTNFKPNVMLPTENY